MNQVEHLCADQTRGLSAHEEREGQVRVDDAVVQIDHRHASGSVLEGQAKALLDFCEEP